MIRVSIDSSSDTVDTSNLQNVGEVLERVISNIPTSRFVSEIELDGKKLKHYLPDSEVGRGIDSIHEVKIHTADRAQWSANGFDIALSSLEKIQRTLIVTAELFRETHNLEGNRLFARCMDGLERFWDSVTLTRTALNLNFSEIVIQGNVKLADLEAQFLDIVRGFVSLQDGQFYEAVADKIEFELIPHLSRWVESMKRLRSIHGANA